MEKQVGVYVRYSAEMNALEMAHNYQELLEQYETQNKGVEIIDIYIDIHKSTTEDRPAYNRLLKDTLLGKINTIVVLGGFDKLTESSAEMTTIDNYARIVSVDTRNTKGYQYVNILKIY